jgi:hypothetical protein
MLLLHLLFVSLHEKWIIGANLIFQGVQNEKIYDSMYNFLKARVCSCTPSTVPGTAPGGEGLLFFKGSTLGLKKQIGQLFS